MEFPTVTSKSSTTPTQNAGENVWNWVEKWQISTFLSTVDVERGWETVRRGFGLIFLVFWDQLFSNFSTRFFEIFAHLAHSQGRWKYEKCEKSRWSGTRSTIWVQGLKEVYRDSFWLKKIFVRKPHEKDFRSSPLRHGQKYRKFSVFFQMGSMNEKMWRSQRVK